MTKGIYCYYDNWDHAIIYVGRDSYIDKNARDKAHYRLSRRDKQRINRVLQNDNFDRYTYHILEQGDYTDKKLNEMEKYWIKYFNPFFNFTEGGDGISGYKHTEETRKKMRENHADFSGENHPFHNKHHTKKSLKKMSETKIGKNNPMHGKIGKEHPNFDIYIKIRKEKSKRYKQGFLWRARPRGLEGKRISISNVDLQKCIELIKEFIDSDENIRGYETFEVIYD